MLDNFVSKQIFSHAKVNLFLHITGRRGNGYHEISSLVVFLESLYDVMHIKKSKQSSICFKNASIDAENSVSQALSLLKKSGFDINYDIVVEKMIPIASGMGGGSSNAAAILNYAKLMYNIKEEIIIEIALKIGLDTIVCIKNRTSLISGLGEKTEKIDLIEKIFIVIINNRKHLYSNILYQEYRNGSMQFSQQLEHKDLTNNMLIMLYNSKNDLQPFAVKIMPEIEEILHELQQQDGCIFSRMSGSGPTCFGVFYDEEKAKNAKKILHIIYPNYCIIFSNVF